MSREDLTPVENAIQDHVQDWHDGAIVVTFVGAVEVMAGDGKKYIHYLTPQNSSLWTHVGMVESLRRVLLNHLDHPDRDED